VKASSAHVPRRTALGRFASTGADRRARAVERGVIFGLVVLFLAVAIPNYVAFRKRANDVTAISSIHSITPSILAYFADHGTYVGMTIDELRSSYDPGLSVTGYSLGADSNLTATSFCVQFTSEGRAWRRAGPLEPVTQAPCL
jgi:hypothetical protein